MSEIITVTGNIGGEPRLIHGADGVPILKLRVASSRRRWDPATNRWTDADPNWYRVCAFRQLATNAFASLHHGQRIVVTGRLTLREWKSGEKSGTSAEIDADSLGHDLRFGTTAFVAVRTPVPATEHDEWAPPGHREEEATAPEAGAPGSDLAPSDVPF